MLEVDRQKWVSAEREIGFFRQGRLATFPDTLVIHAKKFQLVNWVPTKVGECPIESVSTLRRSLTRRAPTVHAFMQTSRSFFRTATVSSSTNTSEKVFNPVRPNSQRMPQVSGAPHFRALVPYERKRSPAEPALPEFNQATLAQLEAMGFPLVRCQKALLATGNSDPEAAMEWLFAHMEDPGWFFPRLAAQPLVLIGLW